MTTSLLIYFTLSESLCPHSYTNTSIDLIPDYDNSKFFYCKRREILIYLRADLSGCESLEIKKIIKNYLKFIKKIIYIIKNEKLENKLPGIDVKITSKPIKEVEKINSLDTKEEKIKEIEKLFKEGTLTIEQIIKMKKLWNRAD